MHFHAKAVFVGLQWKAHVRPIFQFLPSTTTICFGEQKYMLLPFVFHFTYKSQTFVPTIFQHSIEKWSFLALQEWLFCALKAPRGGGGKVKIEYTFDCQWVYSKLRAVERKGKRRKSNHEVEIACRISVGASHYLLFYTISGEIKQKITPSSVNVWRVNLPRKLDHLRGIKTSAELE